MTAAVSALPQKITYSVVTVDPLTAERWLQNNYRNRKLNAGRVAEFASDMASGRWAFNGEPIQFDHVGTLLNGQHRLTAVVESGITQQFLVVRGLLSATQETMDQGTRRTPADQLRISGLDVDNTIAAAIRVYIVWTTGRLFGDMARREAKVTTTEVVRWAHSHNDALTALTEFGTIGYRRIPCRPAVALGVALRLSEIDVDFAREFFGALLSGAGLTSNSPLLALRNRLQRIKDSETKVTDKDIIGFFVMTWNAERQGKALTKLQRPHGGWTVDNFPAPR